MKVKQKKSQQIADLQRKLAEALAGQSHVYHFADAALDRAGEKHLTGSGVVLTMTVLGGHQLFKPVLIRNGLSPELIAALRSDLAKSYEESIAFKPRGVGKQEGQP
jgi:hypothetical protein